jgi:glycosyl transferase, family 25
VTLTHRDIPIWLINLPRATDRRVKMEAQLAKLGVTYRLFPGVDGKAEAERLMKTVDLAAFERNTGRKILMGGIGCYHSHLGVWREFLETGHPIALIMEDDVVFHDDFLPAIDLALQATEHWDFLKLNRIRAKLPIAQGRIGPYTLNAYLGPATGTGAYLINRATAEKLLPAMLPITRPTDHQINRFFKHRFRLFGLEPFPSHLDDGNVSLITGTGFGDVHKFPRYKRLPNLMLRAGNYFRRIAYVAQNWHIIPVNKQLISAQHSTDRKRL